MSNYYYESRKTYASQTANLASDITRHLHSRKHLGKVLVVADNPLGLMSVARKQWLRLTRSVQNQRAATLNADRILRLTYAITHMQRITFVAKTPLQLSNAHVFFVSPDQLTVAPDSCYTVYLNTRVKNDVLRNLLRQLPDSSLIVDYTGTVDAESLGLHPKEELQDNVRLEWQEVRDFMKKTGIELDNLVFNGVQQFAEVDRALDILLSESHRFLQVAGNFQRARELAQPTDDTNTQQQLYEMLSLLAHRVQALAPGAFTLTIDDAFHEEKATYFLHDCPDDHIDEDDLEVSPELGANGFFSWLQKA